MKKSNLYTRSGDTGTTSLIGGTRVRKTDIRLEAYGTVDELNAQLGVLITYLEKEEDIIFLRRVQEILFTVGASLATDLTKQACRTSATMTAKMVEELEQEIDRIDQELPPLRLFLLPGGCRGAALSHVCRTVCRRAERRVLSLAEEGEVSSFLLAYINRLSDYLFVLSRKLNVEANQEEIVWRPNAK